MYLRMEKDVQVQKLTCGLLYGWNWYELGSDLTLSLFYYLTSYYEIYIVK